MSIGSVHRMSIWIVFVLVLYSFGMACGQILFKYAAQAGQYTKSASILLSYLNVYFIGAVILYFSLTVLWVWLLRYVPLSTAYPFVALAFIFTPMLSFIFFGEKISLEYFLGLVLIAGGITVIARQ